MKTHEELLGVTAKDKVTGFRGVVTGYIYYMTGCNQVILQPETDKDGKRRDGEWFDVQRLDVDESVPRITLNNTRTPGSITPPPLPPGH